MMPEVGLNQVVGTHLQVSNAYFNDRTLFGTRTGVGHYLGLIEAHWPQDATVGLKGLSRSFKGNKQSNHNSLYAQPTNAVEPIRCTPLNKLVPPTGAFESDWTKRILRRGFAIAQRRLIKSATRKKD